MDLLVLAKEPRPGRVKTRLCPPCTPAQAAEIAAAALTDTLEACTEVRSARLVVVLDGEAGRWCPIEAVVRPQTAGELRERLRAAWDEVEGPALQLGMDTPQVTASMLDESVAALLEPRCDGVLGLAADGGWWALGLRQPDGSLLADIPTSRPDTGARTLARLREAGLRITLLPELIDVDTWADATSVAEIQREQPGRRARFAAAVERVSAELVAR